ncbi:MAG: hypothetical protein ABJB33_04450 [Gemmatimonadota bacterium]
MRRLLLVACLGACLARPVGAQTCSTPNGVANGSCSVNVASSLTIPTLLRLTIDDTSTALTTPTEAIYDAGTTVSTGPVATIKTNGSWTVLVRATAATWTASGAGARTNKPVGDLAWGKLVGGPFIPMTTTNATVATGTRGASNVTSMFYQVAWSWPNDTPGTYTITVVFTATSP